MTRNFDHGEAAAVRMLASGQLSPRRQERVAWSIVGRSGAGRWHHLERVAKRYRRLLAARGVRADR